MAKVPNELRKKTVLGTTELKSIGRLNSMSTGRLTCHVSPSETEMEMIVRSVWVAGLAVLLTVLLPPHDPNTATTNMRTRMGAFECEQVMIEEIGGLARALGTRSQPRNKCTTSMASMLESSSPNRRYANVARPSRQERSLFNVFSRGPPGTIRRTLALLRVYPDVANMLCESIRISPE